ncbi:MAG: CDP-alcohol phosphatidyltransferase family protein [Proteobacteria bacterium]|nr:CDP-alcohol phosphatidyltransferase family protein [Pseudomonadota bacterium]
MAFIPGGGAARLKAWGVHVYTALGLVVSAVMGVCIVRGGERDFSLAFAMMALATIIDSTDGWLARRYHVKTVVPEFDGRRLDDIVDFHTYTSLPLLLMWRAQILPEAWQWVYLAPLLASAYGFCQASIKTDDGYFLGFPSYWNVVAFYMYALQAPAWFTAGLVLIFSALTFVPSRYLYQSQGGALNRFSNWLSLGWVALLAYIFLNPGLGPLTGESARAWVWASLYYPVYYLVVSWALSLGLFDKLGAGAAVAPTGPSRSRAAA